MRKPIYTDLEILKKFPQQTIHFVETKKNMYLRYEFPTHKFPKVSKATLKKRIKKLLLEAIKKAIA